MQPRASLKVLLVLALPMVLARATQSVMTFADALMVEHLGPQAIAASATGGFNAFLLMILPMGTVFIVQSFVAQLVGAGDRDATPRFAWYGLIISGIAGVIAIGLLPAIDPLLLLADFSPGLREQMSSYMHLRLCRSPRSSASRPSATGTAGSATRGCRSSRASSAWSWTCSSTGS